MLSIFVLIVCGLLVYIALYDQFSRKNRMIRKIPGPRAWPLLGNCLSFMSSLDRLNALQEEMMVRYGHVNQIHVLNFCMVTVTNPEDVELILASPQHSTKAPEYNFAKPWLGEGLPISNGTKWHQRRKMLTKAFHFHLYKKFVSTIRDATEEFLKSIEKETANEQSDVLALMNRMTLRVIYETATGSSLLADEAGYAKYFKLFVTLCELIMMRFYKMWLHNDFLFSLSAMAKEQNLVAAEFHALTDKVIMERRELLDGSCADSAERTPEHNKKTVLLDLLFDNEKAGTINREGIREEVNTIIFAGFDTTATALSFFVMAIANESAIQDKIYEEQQRIFGDSQRTPTIEELNEMKYLECCIKESLRLYPSVPFMSRKLLEDAVLSGHTVPAGSTCIVPMYVIHRRADLFPDPERFDPDRFLPENCRDRHPYAYIPFSAGLRSCIGQKFAMLEMKMLLSALLRKFRVEPATRPSDVFLEMSFILKTKQPLKARFRLRNEPHSHGV